MRHDHGRPEGRTTTRRVWAAVALGSVAALSACGSSAADPTGVWSASDGSPVKTIGANGACSGMYYNGGKPLDIGGGMTCTLSSQKRADGTYTMVVSQPPNRTTYKVAFMSKDVMTLSDVSSGRVIVTLTRQ